MTSAKWQAQEAIKEGLPPVTNATYDDAEGPQGLPVRRPAARAAQGLRGAPGRRPSYSDVTLAIQDSLHPPAGINPQKSINTLKDRLNILADGGMY